jgi:hypothetical protein
VRCERRCLGVVRRHQLPVDLDGADLVTPQEKAHRGEEEPCVAVIFLDATDLAALLPICGPLP